ncbi:1776_t:CDS:2, partial [Gigaspora rosea]
MSNIKHEIEIDQYSMAKSLTISLIVTDLDAILIILKAWTVITEA